MALDKLCSLVCMTKYYCTPALPCSKLRHTFFKSMNKKSKKHTTYNYNNNKQSNQTAKAKATTTKTNMKLSGKGALALLAALAVSGEGASASGGSESIMVCNAFAKFCYALHTSYSAANNTNIHNISFVSYVYTHSYSFSLLHRLLLVTCMKKAGCNPLAKTCQWRRNSS